MLYSIFSELDHVKGKKVSSPKSHGIACILVSTLLIITYSCQNLVSKFLPFSPTDSLAPCGVQWLWWSASPPNCCVTKTWFLLCPLTQSLSFPVPMCACMCMCVQLCDSFHSSGSSLLLWAASLAAIPPKPKALSLSLSYPQSKLLRLSIFPLHPALPLYQFIFFLSIHIAFISL